MEWSRMAHDTHVLFGTTLNYNMGNEYVHAITFTLIMKLGRGIREYSHVHNNITPLSLAVWNIQGEKG